MAFCIEKINIHIPNKINRVTPIGDMQPRKFPPANPLASVESFAVAMDTKNLCLVNGGGGMASAADGLGIGR